MCKSNPYALKSACKDCPFRKDMQYLTGPRILEIINYMKSDDVLFPCHKTVNIELRSNYGEAVSEIEDILSDAQDEEEHTALKSELFLTYGINEMEAKLLTSMHNEEKICAGWLILGKKEGIVFNNFLLRLAAMRGQLSLDELKDEGAVFDSINDAIKSHS